MLEVEGEGTSKVGADSRQMKLFRDPDSSLDDVWYIIPEGMPHEFFPKGQYVVVLSFHTYASDELEEMSCDSGATRKYEPRF